MGVIERHVHGVPVWLMREYLLDMGGQAQGENCVFGDGWEAHFERVEDYKIGSLAIGRVQLKISGDEEALAALEPVLNLKLMRGGG
jgi:hypothetical protein